MKKFDLRGVKEVFANLRGGEKVSSKGDSDVQESLQPHDFFCGKVSFATTASFTFHLFVEPLQVIYLMLWKEISAPVVVVAINGFQASGHQ